VGLDIAGIDLVVKDIARPLAEQGGAIVEVNAGPSLLMHIKPAVGTPRPVGVAIVDHLFPNQDDGRIPVVGITGSSGKTAVAHLVTQLLGLSGKHTGLACSDGFYLDCKQIYQGDHANWKAANHILINRSIEAAVCENGGDSILKEGLAYDWCQVGVVTNVEPRRHYGRYDVSTPEQVFNIFRTQVDVVLSTGAAVLNASEPMLVEMAALCNGEVIYFSMDPDLMVINSHRSQGTRGIGSVQGKRAVLIRDQVILLVTGFDEVVLVRLDEVARADGRGMLAEVENVLAAVAASWALGIAPDVIRKGLIGSLPLLEVE
jgi:cyanophycin synthetase